MISTSFAHTVTCCNPLITNTNIRHIYLMKAGTNPQAVATSFLNLLLSVKIIRHGFVSRHSLLPMLICYTSLVFCISAMLNMLTPKEWNIWWSRLSEVDQLSLGEFSGLEEWGGGEIGVCCWEEEQGCSPVLWLLSHSPCSLQYALYKTCLSTL